MKQVYLSLLITFLLLLALPQFIFSQCQTNVDFNTWIQEGPPSAGNWNVGGGGAFVLQTVNGVPTFFVSPDTFINVRISGTIRVTGSSDDDFIGFVFGYKEPLGNSTNYDTYLFDWKRGNQTDNGFTGFEGYSLSRVLGNIPGANNAQYFWGHTNGPPFTLLNSQYAGNLGWNYNTNYNFTLTYTTTQVIVEINGNTIFTETGCFQPGRFGFYNYSQPNVRYSNFTYELLSDYSIITPDVCPGDTAEFSFVNPSCGSINGISNLSSFAWDFGDGNTGTGPNPTHVYAASGTYNVKLIVTDINGCQDSVTKSIIVHPIPVVDIGPDTTICSTASITLDGTSPTPNILSYEWYDATTNPTHTFDISDGPSTYWLEVTNQGCSRRDSMNLAFEFPLTANVDLGNDTILCPGNIYGLGTSLFGSAGILWSDGSAGDSIFVNNAGTYWLEATNACGPFRDSVDIAYETPPTLNLGNDSLLCQGDQLLLDATFIGITPTTYLWQDGSSNPTFNVSSTGWYWAEISNQCGTIRDSIFVGYEVPPDLDLGNDSILCDGDTLFFDITFPDTSLTSYVWQDGTTDSLYEVTTSGLYWAEISNYCGTLRDSVQLDFEVPPTVDLGNDTVLCLGANLPLDATFTSITPTTYTWQDGSNLPTFTITDSSIYWVELSNLCGTLRDSIIAPYDSIPLFELGNDSILCDGDTLTLDATFIGETTTNYTWSTSDITPMIEVTTTDLYWAETSNFCGTHRDSLTATFEVPPTLDLGNDTILCLGATLPFDVTFNSITPTAYTWQDGSNLPTFTATDSGIYWVEISNLCGTLLDSMIVEYDSIPILDLGNDSILCVGDTLILDATFVGATSTNYLWQDGSTNPTYTVTTSGLYSVQTDNLCGLVFDDIQVDFEVPPTIALGNDTILCDNATLLLDGTFNSITPTTYLWHDGSNAATFNVNTDITPAWVELSNLCGTARDSMDILYDLSPTVDLGQGATLCDGDEVVLDATFNSTGASPLTYIWQDGSANPTYTVTAAGVYNVTLANFCGTAQDGVQYNYLAIPQPFSLGNDTILCPGQTISFSVFQPDAFIQWQDGSNDSVYTVSSEGTYTVSVSNQCATVSDDVLVEYETPPSVELGNDTILCVNETLTLDATFTGLTPTTYQWQDGNSNATYVVSTDGVYVVNVDNLCGSASDLITVDYVFPPVVDLGADTSLCVGDTKTLDATAPNSTYQWSTGSSNATITVSAPGGNYEVRVTNEACTFTTNIDVDYYPVANLSLPNDTLLCWQSDQAPVLDATVASDDFATYQWSNGSSNQIITADSPAVYSVIVQDVCGTYTDSMLVEYEYCICNVFMPNAFSPNGDGYNDFFGATYDCNILNSTLRIFNRWGNLIHEGPITEQWDGTGMGNTRIVPEGVYVWVLEYRGEKGPEQFDATLKGSVTVIK